jgi:hypothetical protein
MGVRAMLAAMVAMLMAERAHHAKWVAWVSTALADMDVVF